MIYRASAVFAFSLMQWRLGDSLPCVCLQAIAGKVAVSLLSPSAFTFAADLIGQYEGSGVGLHWSDMWSDPLPLGAIIFLLALDAKLYAGLAW